MKKKKADDTPKKRDDTKRSDTQPMRKKEDVQQSNDERIDQDFPGYPHHPSKDSDRHNGSANAFERTEDPAEDED